MGVISLLCLVVFAAASVSAGDNTDYCSNDYKCNGKEHYACKKEEKTQFKFESPGGGPSLDCTVKTIISPAERGILLGKVNDFRNNVAKGKAGFSNESSDIRQLRWDYKLERFARLYGSNEFIGGLAQLVSISGTYWLKMCAKTKELNKVDALFIEGQQGAPPKIDEAVNSWTKSAPDASVVSSFVGNPHQMAPPLGPPGGGPPQAPPGRAPPFGPPGGAPPFGPPGGAPSKDIYTWTMLAWAGATKLGCAFGKQDCKIPASGGVNPPAVQFLFCFIGSDVNTDGQPVFKTGSPCSECPPSTKCKSASAWPSLCAADDDPTKVEDIPDLAITLRSGTFTILLLSHIVSCV